MKSYIFSVCAAAVIAGILRTLTGKGTAGELVKLLSGIFLALTVMAPLARLEIPDPVDWVEDHARAGREAAAAGEVMAGEYAADIISREVEAYILDKAHRLGADLTVEVSLDPRGIPEEVTITGEISGRQRMELSRYMAEQLEVGEEAQIWTDGN